MARPPQELLDVARDFVCVRITDMRQVELDPWRFDFDLTFAAVTATPGNGILHRYGSRAAHDPQSHLSMPSLLRLLRGTKNEVFQGDPGAAFTLKRGAPAKKITDVPSFKKREKEKKVDCVHCHTVNDFEWRDAVAGKRWKREQAWVFPDLARLGLEVDRDDQQQVTRVVRGSPAGKAGIVVGERLHRAGTQQLLTRADLQWVLHLLPATKTTLSFELRDPSNRGMRTVTLELPAGWKECDPLEYAWRPFKWNLGPFPGFGGKPLTSEEKQQLGLDPTRYAGRIDYLVTWGDKASTGKNAQEAGLKKGDVVLSVAGKSDFESEDHFQAWYRLTQKTGETVDVAVFRDGERLTVKLPVVE